MRPMFRDACGEFRFFAAEPVQRFAHDLQLALDSGSDQVVGTEASEVEIPPEVLDRPSGVEGVG